MNADLSANVRRFLTQEIVSVERLDVLLAMHQHSERWWEAHELAEELRMPVDVVQSHLEHLSGHNLLDVRVAQSLIYHYKPGTEELRRLVNSLAGDRQRGSPVDSPLARWKASLESNDSRGK